MHVSFSPTVAHRTISSAHTAPQTQQLSFSTLDSVHFSSDKTSVRPRFSVAKWFVLKTSKLAANLKTQVLQSPAQRKHNTQFLELLNREQPHETGTIVLKGGGRKKPVVDSFTLRITRGAEIPAVIEIIDPTRGTRLAVLGYSPLLGRAGKPVVAITEAGYRHPVISQLTGPNSPQFHKQIEVACLNNVDFSFPDVKAA